jgi:hypothetical protein
MAEQISNPWDVRETDFPIAGTSAEKLRFLLNYAVLAPSGHNSQPWLFIDRVGRTFDLGNGQAASDRQLATGSPVLAVLGTDVDTAYDWLMAGQALARVLLYARSQGVWASFLNQPIEVPEVRLMLHNLLERVGFPQLLLRMGYGPEVPPTPRRSVGEVLL